LTTSIDRDDELIRFYGEWAPDYEAIYRRADPARQREQDRLAETIQRTFRDRRVLEIACGTGYWTRYSVEVAEHIVAVDASLKMLDIAQAKPWPSGKIEFRQADAYNLQEIKGEFDAGLACFWLSHVPRRCVEAFLDGFHKQLGQGAVVFMADNVYVAGLGGQLVDGEGEDTHKLRELADGSQHTILKNYYDAEELRDILSAHACELQICVGTCFWWLTYVVS